MFSRRVPAARSPNRLLAALEERRRAGLPPLDLTESNPTRCGFPYQAKAVLAALADPRGMVYEPDPRGLRPAREAVAAYYRDHGRAVEPDHIVLASGTSEAYGMLFKLLAQPGDEIMVPKPGYPLLEVLSALEAATIVPYPLRLGPGGWAVDLDRLENTVSTRTVAVAVVSPNNPTGSYLKRRELDRLVDLADRFHLALIVDEVFSDYGADPDPEWVISAAGEARLPCFVLNGLSKTVGLPQLKLAWIVVSGPVGARDEALRRLEFIADAYLSVSAGVQHAAASLLGGRAAIQGPINARLAANEAVLRESLTALSWIRGPPREGGWYILLDCSARLPQGGDEALALDLLDHGVYVHPGYFYDFGTDGYLVLSLLTPPDVFCEGVERMSTRLG